LSARKLPASAELGQRRAGIGVPFLTANNSGGERALGELWRERPKAKPPGDNQYKKMDRSKFSTEAPATLAELGLNKDRASRDLCFAEIEKEFFEQCIADRRTEKISPKNGLISEPQSLLDRLGLFSALGSVAPYPFPATRRKILLPVAFQLPHGIFNFYGLHLYFEPIAFAD
jgi:hypothetical protein